MDNNIPVFKCQRRRWHPTPVLLPGKSHGRRSLVGCNPWGREESDTTERVQFHFSLSCIGEGNGNPLQSSCLENPRDGGAWWAAVYGVTQSRTRLKRLSSSSSRRSGKITGFTARFWKKWRGEANNSCPWEEIAGIKMAWAPAYLKCVENWRHWVPATTPACLQMKGIDDRNQPWIITGRDSCWGWSSNTLVTWCKQLTH